jgi:Ca2+-binding EF-hand superfamily protein
MTYMEAQTKLQELTAKEFADAYVKADADGNGSLKQDEIIDAMNGDKKNAKKIQSMFWDSDKTLPVLVNGTWQKQSVSTGKSNKSAGNKTQDKAEWVRRLNSGEGDIDALIEQNGYKNHVADLYSAAKKRNPNITADEYISAFKAADTNGNGGVTQAEIKALMKREPQNADRYYSMLWSDKWKKKLK